jgi:hypothetical protein
MSLIETNHLVGIASAETSIPVSGQQSGAVISAQWSSPQVEAGSDFTRSQPTETR